MKPAILRLALIHAVGLLWSFAAAADLSDSAAHQIATRMESAVSAAEVSLLRAATANDRSSFPVIVEPVRAALKAWPPEHLDNRASFPYWGCKQLAVTFLQAADIWRRSDPSELWQRHVMKNFKADGAECRSALRSPDMSLKDIR